MRSGATTRLLRTRGDVSDTHVAANAAEYHALLAKDAIVAEYEARVEDLERGQGRQIRRRHSGKLARACSRRWPTSSRRALVMGDFEETFLPLPKEVLVMVMRKHQRYFPVEKRGRFVEAALHHLLPTGRATSASSSTATKLCFKRVTRMPSFSMNQFEENIG